MKYYFYHYYFSHFLLPLLNGERKTGKDLEMMKKSLIFVPIKLLDDIMCYEKGVSK